MNPLEWNPFKNKKVALVGNASLKYTKEEIEELENHDLVCRINDGVFTDIHKHLGTKVDIGFFAHTWKWDFTNLKCDICIVTKLPEESNNKALKSLIEKHKKKPQNNIKYNYIPTWITNEIGELLGRNIVPSSGAYILNFLRYTELTKLNIYNFDWKKTPSFYQAKVWTHPHNFKIEEQHFLSLIETQPNWNLVK